MRKNLTGAVIFTDIRNPMRELDVSMFEMLHQRRIPILIVLTKSDKVSQETALETYNELEKVFGYSLCFSVKDKKSIGQLVLAVNELLSN
jgi:GTP-binding protein